MNASELIFDKKTNQIPVSFWRHFAENELIDGLQHPEVQQINLDGHKHYLAETQPDFVKLMSDGYFNIPLKGVKDVLNLDDLNNIEAIDADDAWLTEQIRLVQQQVALAGKRKTFYNIFSPVSSLKWQLTSHGVKNPDHLVAKWYQENPEKIKHILTVLANDTIQQIHAVVKEGGASGIYFSTQELQGTSITEQFFREVQKEIDQKVITAIIQTAKINILHICGFEGATNHLDWFKDYDLSIVNWSVKAEKISLREGQALFSNKVVLGGFGNGENDVLYSGSVQQIKETVNDILNGIDKNRIIIGADCTIQRTTPIENLKAAIVAAKQVVAE
ncbi:uroporphyrinogen decarboxylase family protein [Eupransor demetentiae]|uniref:Uroporphyrinogen-III decarboxylase HemE (HemE) n=1 Tax=Eupransor demetentiae TaxID=3109584 RepID=A0ABM9N437_9LACO|nr:Uroporphyrinogen-III decarboxylase HemE (HemE) [Lactobacillaceae bacterium LMG 33000]